MWSGMLACRDLFHVHVCSVFTQFVTLPTFPQSRSTNKQLAISVSQSQQTHTTLCSRALLTYCSTKGCHWWPQLCEVTQWRACDSAKDTKNVKTQQLTNKQTNQPTNVNQQNLDLRLLNLELRNFHTTASLTCASQVIVRLHLCPNRFPTKHHGPTWVMFMVKVGTATVGCIFPTVVSKNKGQIQQVGYLSDWR